MLQKTFIHLDGIGCATERKLWHKGVLSWHDLLAHGMQHLPGSRREAVQCGVRASIRHYAAGNWDFFDKALPPAQKWRAGGAAPQNILFLDIETTGLTEADAITMIGTFNGRESKTFIAGINLEEASRLINACSILITFNGTCFDLPLIRRRFRDLSENHIHIDLRYPLHWLGLHGGLKAIERQMGIARSPETARLDGWDAVRLWNQYLGGRREALDLLKKYNAEDVRNLKPLLDRVCRLGTQKLNLP